MIPILYLSHCGSSIGGGEKQLFYLITNLDRSTYNPYVVCPDDGIFAEKLRNSNIPTTILNLPQWRKAKSLLIRHRAASQLTDFVKHHKIKLIHTSDSWLNPYLCHVKKRINIPVISHVRNILSTKQISKYSFNLMDHIIAISNQSKETLVNSGIDHVKIDVILNCVDLSEFQPSPLVNKTDTFVIGLVGRIEPFKRQKELIEIASIVHRQCKNVKFHIIGETLDTPKHKNYEHEVRQLITDKKLDDIIYFSGYRNDMPQALHEIDILLTLSAGSVIAEAMATGLPVIGTHIGSTKDMIVNEVTGWIIPSDAIEKISHKIVQLATDSELCKKMGKAARKHAVDNFNIELHIQKIHEIYEKLLYKFLLIP